jgi:hypothetical protein
MKNKMTTKFLFVSFLIQIISLNIYAQDKQLTFQQVYLFAEPRLFNPNLQIIKWIDDENYLIQKRSPTTVLIKVNAKTGEEEVFLDYASFDDILLEYELTIDNRITNSNDYKGIYLRKMIIFSISILMKRNLFN